MILLILLYLMIGAVVCGANYFVMQDKEGQRYFDELNCTLGSIIIGIFWPICIGVVAPECISTFKSTSNRGLRLTLNRTFMVEWCNREHAPRKRWSYRFKSCKT